MNEAIGKNIFTPGNYYMRDRLELSFKMFSFIRRIYRKISR